MTTTTSSRSGRLTLRPHQFQYEMIQAQAPFCFAIWGTGAGKTVLGMVRTALQMAARPGELWLVTEPTWQMVDRILMRPSEGRPSLLQILRAFDPGAIYVKSDSAIYTDLGTILLGSASHPESMEGAHVAGAWPDEIGLYSRLAFETICRRVSYKGGQVFGTTTPYNRGWLYQDVYKRAMNGDPDYFVSRCSSLANPKYPREVYERNRRNMTPERFRMMHEGGFERPEGMIFERWDDADLVEPFDIPESWTKYMGLDFGWNHPFAAVGVAKDDDGTYYLYDEYRRSKTEVPRHYQELTKRFTGSRKPDIIYRDPAGKDEAATLARLGLTTALANNDVLNGISTVNSLMAQHRLKVFKDCVFWQEEVEGYVWDDQAGVFIDKPKKIDDDLMDATRYVLHSVESKTEFKLWT